MDDIDSWIVPSHLQLVLERSNLKAVGLSLRPPVGGRSVTADPPTIIGASPANTVNDKIFIERPSGRKLSLNEILTPAQRKAKCFETVPLDGKHVTGRFILNIQQGLLSVLTTDGEIEVEQIRVELELWHDMVEVPIEATFTRYSNSEGPPVHRAEFQTKFQDVDVMVALQSPRGSPNVLLEFALSQDLGASQLSVSLQPPP